LAGQQNKKKITVRVEKYKELKDLWEKINQKVILEYRVENEAKFQDFFVDFLSQESNFKTNQLVNKTKTITIENNQADFKEKTINSSQIPLSQISNQKYSNFLDKLAKTIFVNKKTLHNSFCKIQTKFDINNHLNEGTIRQIQTKFRDYLLANAISKMEISYQKVTNTIHPTGLTKETGELEAEISDSGIYSNQKVADNYLFEDFFYDSELERQNIQTDIKYVVVFTKIPKNSIKIPVAGGQSYSPDFGYVLNFENGTKKLYFIVETKNVDGEDDLRNTEKQKIKYAEKLFGDTIKIKFTTQFSSDKISTLIQNIHQNSNQI
jgi:type III restriction enzyme